jgi:hypothetical protein
MTKAERIHMAKVAELGCLLCGAIPELHHIRSGQGLGQRASNFEVLPLCSLHHRTGGPGIAFHAGRRTWEAQHGSERELLERVRGMI